MNDMENKDMGGSLENNIPAEKTDAEKPAENKTPGEQAYQYQPPVNRQTPPYGGYSFGQHPAPGAAQTPPPHTPPPADQWSFPEYGTPAQKPENKKKEKDSKFSRGSSAHC